MSSITHILQNIPVDPPTGVIDTPVYQTSAFVQDALCMNSGNLVPEIEDGKDTHADAKNKTAAA